MRKGPQEGLLWLPTDEALHDDPEFRKYFERYAADQASFFADYSAAHVQLSERAIERRAERWHKLPWGRAAQQRGGGVEARGAHGSGGRVQGREESAEDGSGWVVEQLRAELPRDPGVTYTES